MVNNSLSVLNVSDNTRLSTGKKVTRSAAIARQKSAASSGSFFETSPTTFLMGGGLGKRKVRDEEDAC